MKNLVFFLTALVFGTGTSYGAEMAATVSSVNSRSFIFTEGDITFSVYPDGEFDFYLNNQVGFQAGVIGGQGAISFNAGYNYNPYVQYDDFGAVIQISQLPVYYDYYGRVNRIGNIHMTYRNGRLYRLGGMRIYYNGFGYYNYHLGYINPYNRVYVYQPFHSYFVRPAAAYCMVYPQPYRHYYNPVRYTYYRPYHNNVRRAYAHVGKPYKYQNRAERSRVYKNDRRVVARSTAGARSNSRSVAGRSSGDRTIKATRTQRASTSRSSSAIRTKGNLNSGRSLAENRTKGRTIRDNGKSGNQRSVASSRTSTRTVKSNGNAYKGRSIAGNRTSARKTGKVSPPSKTVSKQTFSRTAKKESASNVAAARRSGSKMTKRKDGIRTSNAKSNRSATASRSTDRNSGRTSRRSSGY
ncbi:hypothetical protein [Robiginitalea aurantiaca]|uniref:Sperm nuclear basic protein PL-I n=1 Tax=Robiginitalea aurantiaca TaxID=3056915 RepID=A0ABT7WG13_9FLAO|nr:hypothetical protein [Robiginitalea aurantiaca]MDM9631857.1 hypothetical protein [Robiginitalea aurantiaca]